MPSSLRSAKRQTTQAVTSLGRLVARMALDDALHRAYLDDPESVIEDAGLNDDEIEALESGDWERIVELLGPGDRGGGEGHRDPGGDGTGG